MFVCLPVLKQSCGDLEPQLTSPLLAQKSGRIFPPRKNCIHKPMRGLKILLSSLSKQRIHMAGLSQIDKRITTISIQPIDQSINQSTNIIIDHGFIFYS